jgi:hypothetical protein
MGTTMSTRNTLRLRAPGMEAYFYETTLENGEAGFMYLLAPSDRKEMINRELSEGRLPHDVIVLEAGVGQPSERLQYEMALYYGVHAHGFVAA